MLFKETIAVYCENHTKPINTLRGRNYIQVRQVVHIVTTRLQRVKQNKFTYLNLGMEEEMVAGEVY
jgi:hypothetical protein